MTRDLEPELEQVFRAQREDFDSQGITPTARVSLNHAQRVAQRQEAEARKAVIERLKKHQPEAARNEEAAYQACMVLREDVKQRSTLTFGDSLEDVWKKNRNSGRPMDELVGTLDSALRHAPRRVEAVSHGDWEKASKLGEGMQPPIRPAGSRNVRWEAASLSKLQTLATQAEQYERQALIGQREPNSPPLRVEVGPLAKEVDAALKQFGPELGRGDQGLLLQKTLIHLRQLSGRFAAEDRAPRAG